MEFIWILNYSSPSDDAQLLEFTHRDAPVTCQLRRIPTMKSSEHEAQARQSRIEYRLAPSYTGNEVSFLVLL